MKSNDNEYTMKNPTLSLSKLSIAVLMAVSCNVHAITPSDVFASEKSNKAKYTLDDDISTRWSVKGDDGSQWIQYDFANTPSLNAIKIAFNKGDRRNQNFEIQTSENGFDWLTELAAVSSGSTLELETFTFDETIATQHLRVVGYGNTNNKWNSITEVSFVEASDDEQLIDDDKPGKGNRPAQGEQPVDDEDLSDKEQPDDDEAPSDEEQPDDDEAPSDEEQPVDDEAPSDEDQPVDDEAPSDEDQPVDDEAPSDEDQPVDDEDLSDEDQPVDDEDLSETEPEDETDPSETSPGYVAPIIDESREPTTSNVITVGSGQDYTSIQAAIDAIDNVDTTILISAGSYSENVELDTCGSSAGYIVIQGEEGAIMSATSGDAFYLEDCSYVKIRGLEITGYDQGIEVAQNSDSIYIENNYLHHIGDSENSLVVYVHGGDSVDPNENIFVLNNEMSYNTTGNSEVLTINGNVDGFLIQGNHVHHNNNIGIDVIGFEGNGPDGYDQARNGVISDNVVEFISTEGGDGFDRNPTYDTNDYSAGGIYIDGGKNIIIERNTVRDCDLGIELASEHSGENTENIIVRNNFISNSYQGNITMGGWKSSKGNAVNIEIYNNTTYNGKNAEILVQNNTSNVTIKNNIFYAKDGNDYLYNDGSNNSDFTVSNNIYYGASISETGSWSDSNARLVDPKLSNVSSGDLHIGDSSPAIDAGTSITDGGDYDIDGEARNNGAVDIGADER